MIDLKYVCLANQKIQVVGLTEQHPLAKSGKSGKPEKPEKSNGLSTFKNLFKYSRFIWKSLQQNKSLFFSYSYLIRSWLYEKIFLYIFKLEKSKKCVIPNCHNSWQVWKMSNSTTVIQPQIDIDPTLYLEGWNASCVAH